MRITTTASSGRCGTVARTLFGAHGQLAVGIVSVVIGVAAWVYGATLHGEALLRFIFHVSMYFGVMACYAVIATALGYRATERVEAHVMPDSELDSDP